MNIFYLSEDPKQAAIWHCDKHCRKMILEYTQQLVTARVMKGELSVDAVPPECLREDGHIKYYTYRMRNHPCSVWVREDRRGFTYVTQLLSWLCEEFSFRWGKTHATETFYFDLLPEANIERLFPHRRRAKPVPLAVSGNQILDCPIETYRAFYMTKQERWPLQWTRRERPPWYEVTNE